MDKTKQRIAIAKACGINPDWYRTSEGDINISPLPDYLNDLNAMRKAEDLIYSDANLACEYSRIICHSEDIPSPIRATASQRAEAFLKTLKRWEA